MRQGQGKGSHARLSRSEQAFELDKEAPRAEEERFGMNHFGRQVEARGEALRQREEFSRIRQLAQCAVELVDQTLAATLRQPFARQLQQLANRPDANLFKEGIL